MSNPKITVANRNLGIFFKSCRRRSYKAKRVIIHSGDRSNSLFYILSGSVAVIVEDSDGKEITLTYLNSGNFVGEMGLFEKNRRSARIKAKTECELADISYRNFFLSAQNIRNLCLLKRDRYLCVLHIHRARLVI